MNRELSYSDFRAKALKFNAEAQQYSFCKSINGGCCVRNVPLIREDKELIKDAVQKKEIPRETMRRAQRRARDKELNECVFLGEQGECTIYSSRPVVCINHGNGGIPKDEQRRMQILGGSSGEISVKDIAPFSCADCISNTDQEGAVPEEIARKGMIIKYELNRRPTTSIEDFLTKELPHY